MILLALACAKETPGIDTSFQDADEDGVEWLDDCDDYDAEVGAPLSWYADTDGDGFGNPATATDACEQPNAFVLDDTDCDDSNGAVNPAATEVCNGIDDDCDGALDGEDDDVDLSTGRAYYADADGDGYGDPEDSVESCSIPDGYTTDDSDCDDAEAAINPDAPELCNEVDDDCDGAVDDSAEDATTWYADLDEDGYGHPTETTVDCEQPDDHVANDQDCDDGNPDANPDEIEVCDGFDNDCDGDSDEASATDATTWYDDGDEDGFGDPDDSEVACDAPEGFIADGTDCVDTDNDIFPGADELCNDEDDDCDGEVDEDSAVDAGTWYDDADSDGYGDATTAVTACDAPSGTVDVADDCDDDDDEINPDADEVCDDVDNDCDGTVDNDSALDADTWYADTDSDSYGDAGSSTTACDQPSGYVADDTDCDDGESDAFPDSTATETPGDGIDTDCDGNDFCTDLNCDGRADLAFAEHYSGSSYTAALTLYFNDGNGSFSDGDTTSLTTVGSYEVAADDLDDDGYIDLIVPNYRDSSTRIQDSYVYWGSVTGYSTTDRTDLATVGAVDVGVGDFDGDGYDDLAFANHYSDSTYVVNNYVYWGSATGFSESNRTSLTGYGTRRVAVADLDTDGYDDLVACHYHNGSTHSTSSYVWYGSSTGFNSSSRDALPTNGCLDVIVEDLDADGTDDIAFAGYYGSGSYTTSSYVYYGTSTGFTTSSSDALSTTGATAVVTGDFDGDGTADLAFSGYYTGGWATSADTTVYYDGTSGFGTSAALGSGGHHRLSTADLDGDGADELLGPQYYVSGSAYTTDSTIWWGGSSGLTDSDVTELAGYGTSSLSPGDFDRDGSMDLAMGGYYTGSWSTLANSTIWYGDDFDSGDTTSLSTAGVWAPVLVVGE